MVERKCPGLPADWLNGWLAAVGSTVLVPGMTLRWSDDPVPVAVLAVADGPDNPAEAIANAVPAASEIEQWPIARRHFGVPELTWEPDLGAWESRAKLARRKPESWTLSSAYTDLAWSRQTRANTIARGQFSAPAPRGTTLWDRLAMLVEALPSCEVGASLDGSAPRLKLNGLGFDMTRVGSLADATHMLVDPVIEVLAFFAMAIFPVRGDGRSDARQRAWSGSRMEPGAFSWPAWSPALDSFAIDAFLDLPLASMARAGAIGRWQIVQFEARGASDVTRAYGSRRVA